MNKLNNLSECGISNRVYSFFRERSDEFGPVEIIKTRIGPNKRTSKTESDTSYSFLMKSNEDKKQCIERVFNVDLLNISDSKIDHRITTIHSSALAALLCFYKISSNNPLKINLNDNLYLFTEVEIEYSNKCMEKGGPSKIDVALFSKDKKVVLFLEAKFSEYLKSECIEISNQYKTNKIFSDNSILPRMLDFSDLRDGTHFKIISKKRGKGRYREGIKQMLCHYIGATHFIEKKSLTEKVFIGTLLFDFGEMFKVEFDDYQAMYKELAENLNSLNNNRIELVNNVITYQNLFKDNTAILDKKVRIFYDL